MMQTLHICIRDTADSFTVVQITTINNRELVWIFECSGSVSNVVAPQCFRSTEEAAAPGKQFPRRCVRTEVSRRWRQQRSVMNARTSESLRKRTSLPPSTTTEDGPEISTEPVLKATICYPMYPLDGRPGSSRDTVHGALCKDGSNRRQQQITVLNVCHCEEQQRMGLNTRYNKLKMFVKQQVRLV